MDEGISETVQAAGKIRIDGLAQQIDGAHAPPRASSTKARYVGAVPSIGQIGAISPFDLGHSAGLSRL